MSEVLQFDVHVRVERVEIVDGHEARGHVPLVRPGALVRAIEVLGQRFR